MLLRRERARQSTVCFICIFASRSGDNVYFYLLLVIDNTSCTRRLCGPIEGTYLYTLSHTECVEAPVDNLCNATAWVHLPGRFIMSGSG